MILANNGIIPPKQWHHDPLLKNSDKETVAKILINRKIMPPREWMYDYNIRDECNRTLKSYL